MRANVLLVCISILLTAFVAEGVSRLIFPAPRLWLDPQTRHLVSPLLGWELPPNTRSFTIDAPVSINSHRLRDDEIPRSKPRNETRILCLGDSFTFALGIRFEDLYVQQLEYMLNQRHTPRRFQAINAGVVGYNTRQELIYLLADGFTLEPDVIVVAFYWNDLMGNEQELPDLETTPRASAAGSFTKWDQRRHTIPTRIRNVLRRSVLLYQIVRRTKILLATLRPPKTLYTRTQSALLRGDQAILRPVWQATAKHLRQIAEESQTYGVPVILLVFPMENQLRRDYPNLRYVERLREIWEPTGMPLVDLEPAYRRALTYGENPFLPYDGHPNAFGMRIAAEHLYTTLRDHEMLNLQ